MDDKDNDTLNSVVRSKWKFNKFIFKVACVLTNRTDDWKKLFIILFIADFSFKIGLNVPFIRLRQLRNSTLLWKKTDI